jgi:hypothetical protein
LYENKVGFTLVQIREEIQEAVSIDEKIVTSIRKLKG